MVAADISRVEPWLYVGAEPKQGEVIPDDIRAVINLRRDPPRLGPVDVYGHNIESYLWRPLEDGVCPGLAWLRLTVDLAEEFCRRNQPLLIHCLLGVSRSPMVAIAVLMRIQRLRLDVAMQKLSILRRGAYPDEAFLTILREFEGSLR